MLCVQILRVMVPECGSLRGPWYNKFPVVADIPCVHTGSKRGEHARRAYVPIKEGTPSRARTGSSSLLAREREAQDAL